MPIGKNLFGGPYWLTPTFISELLFSATSSMVASRQLIKPATELHPNILVVLVCRLCVLQGALGCVMLG